MPKPKPKPKKQKGAAQKATAADLGPEARRRRGDVIVGFRPDADHPDLTSFGARRCVWYHMAWAEGFLSHTQHEAADRYLVRLEQHEGATEGSPATAAGIRGAGYSGPTERQVAATADLRAADGVLGADKPLIRAVIGWNLTPSPDQATVVAKALQRLADYWRL